MQGAIDVFLGGFLKADDIRLLSGKGIQNQACTVDKGIDAVAAVHTAQIVGDHFMIPLS